MIRSDAARRAGSRESARREALYEGLYLDQVFRWRPSAWPVTRHVNGWLAARSGTEVKATRERYFELVLRYSDRMRTQSDARQLLLGLLLHSDDMFPGYAERVLAWSRDLRGLLHQPALGRSYLELCAPLIEAGVACYLCVTEPICLPQDTSASPRSSLRCCSR